MRRTPPIGSGSGWRAPCHMGVSLSKAKPLERPEGAEGAPAFASGRCDDRNCDDAEREATLRRATET